MVQKSQRESIPASQQLDAINAKVEQRSAEIDQKHGVLLDYQERNDLKLDLIAQQVVANAVSDDSKTVEAITEDAVETYEITDPADKRRLLIKVESQLVIQKGVGQGGTTPEYP